MNKENTNRGPSDKIKWSLSRIFSESFMIILSVLLALFINEWRTDYNEKIETQELVSNIQSELVENATFLSELIPYHETVGENVKQAIDADSTVNVFYTDERFHIFGVAPKGLVQGQFDEIVWTVALQDEITNRIPLDHSKALFRVYEQQNTVKGTINRIIDLISGREIQRRDMVDESITIFKAQIDELIGQEYYLNSKYQEALELIGN